MTAPPVTPTPPTSFLPRLLRQIAEVLAAPSLPHPTMRMLYAKLQETLEDSYTKRILFSARQIGLFDGIGAPPTDIQRKLRLPFEQFYLELDDDLVLARPFSDGDTLYLRAMLVSAHAGLIMDGGASRDGPPLTLEGHPGHTVLDVAFFYRSAHLAGAMVDAEWIMCLDCGRGHIPAVNVQEEPTTGLTLPDGLPDDWLVAAPEDAQDGALYYVAQGTALLSYMLAYLSAKSISIREEPVSRQQRRWLMAHQRQPRPWHLVTVEPRINNQPPPEEEPVGTHAFRYDVIGHLRFNRHRLATGEYRHTVEWVPAHQRGLDHVEYIPKTYRVKAGREIHPAMRRYWGLP